MFMFDSLNRHFLPAWNEAVTDLPNFKRLQDRTVVFDRCYAGSMPCMPARRELHTGRYNFLHRSWGPLEPFDDSVPQMLKEAGIHTHLVTDHQHYWEDGGATYHNRYSTYEFFRGQEGDLWKGEVVDPETPDTLTWRRGKLWRQDWVNRKYMQTHETHSQTRTVDAGIEFIETNKQAQNWFLQIECFDPHEPFFSSPEFKELIGPWDGDHFDWPDYRPVLEDKTAVEHLRDSYSALLAMCDASLGRVLDAMDENDMWNDTALMVCTDHGLLLGEREWYGKNVQPWYRETINTPLFIWDPRLGKSSERRAALVQTIDFGPTLLDIFDLKPTPDMQGRSVVPVIRDDSSHRKAALFGNHGGHVNVTDGRYVYMRACKDGTNAPLEDYTLMPTRMDHRYQLDDLSDAELVPPFEFTKNTKVLKTRARPMGNSYHLGTRLYDLNTDPSQLEPIRDAALERYMANLLVDLMRANDAPVSQFERMGLPSDGPVDDTHLLIEAQWPQVQSADTQNWREHPASKFCAALNTPICELTEHVAAGLIGQALGLPLKGEIAKRFAHLTPWHLAVMLPSVTPERLLQLNETLKLRADA